MDMKQKVIQLYLQEKSRRQIVKVLKISRNTVAKYIRTFEVSKSVDVRNLSVTGVSIIV